jgi:hypothetical protein
VSAHDPSPVAVGDAYLELDSSGRLMELQVVPSRRDAGPAPAGAIDWSPLVAAASLDPGRLKPAEPLWGPLYAFDTRAAWEGASDDEPTRVEAAARHGRVVYFRAAPTWMAQPARWDVVAPRAYAFQERLNAVLILGSIAFFAVLAVRNLRLGRGDRRGAGRLSAMMAAMLALGNVLTRHWSAASGASGSGAAGPVMEGLGTIGPTQQVVATLGPPLFLALAIWLAYVGFEPYVRRRWPHLLIASTRLLDGRWRDPLVGRSLMTGVAGAIATFLLIFAGNLAGRLAGWGAVVPTFAAGTLDGVMPFAGYIARITSVSSLIAVIYLAILLLARLVLRSTAAAWLGLIAVCFAMFVAWGRVFLGPSPAVVGLFAFAVTAGSVAVLWRGGLLALAVWIVAIVVLRDTPWTPALTQWYAWPTWFSATRIAGLLVWGFRNVLGRQSAFSSES